MEDKIKSAFGEIRANEELKTNTKMFVAHRSRGFKRRAVYRKAIPAVSAALLLFAGVKLYFTPTARIDVEINPSVELGVNMFDRVVSVKPLNDDGKALIQTIDLKFASYDEALRRIIDNENISAMLSEDEVMTITVIENNTAQSEKIFSGAMVCADGHNNVYCYSASSEEQALAHEAGLPCGKYRAFLELKRLDPDVTSDDVRKMTMSEIRSRIAELSENTGSGVGNGHHGNGHHGNGYE